MNDDESTQQLLEATHGFHDAITTWMLWESAEYINEARELELHGYGNLHLRMASQLTDVAPLELRFVGVRHFAYSYDIERKSEIVLDSQGVSARFMTWDVQAKHLEYREAPASGGVNYPDAGGGRPR